MSSIRTQSAFRGLECQEFDVSVIAFATGARLAARPRPSNKAVRPVVYLLSREIVQKLYEQLGDALRSDKWA